MRFLLLIWLIYFNSFGQQKSTSITIGESKKARTHIEDLALANADSACIVANRLLLASQKSKSEATIAIALNALAFAKAFQNNSKEAISINSKSFEINKKLKIEEEIAQNYLAYGYIYLRKSDYVIATKFFLKSLGIAQNKKLYSLAQVNYRNLSVISNNEGNFRKALNYGLKALEVEKKHPNLLDKANNFLNMATTYGALERFDLAEYYYQKSYDAFLKTNNQRKIAKVLTNWSLIQKDLSTAISMQLKAQKIYDAMAPQSLLSIGNLNNLASKNFELAKKDTLGNKIIKTKYLHESEKYYLRCLTLAKKKKDPHTLLYVSGSLAKLQAYQGNYKESYANLLLSNTLSDSLFSQENKNKIAALESEKEIALKNKEIFISKLTIQTKEKQKWYFIIGLSLLGIIGVLLLYQNRSRRKINQKLELLNVELDNSNKVKAQFFSILNHDLRSPISNLIHFLHLQKENPELLDIESKKRMENKTITGAENLLNSMEDMLLWSKGQMENFTPQHKNIAVNSIFEDTKNHFSSEEHIKILFENLDKIQLNTDENYLKTIIRNLTGNAIKALTGIKNPTIIWKAWQENNQTYLSITDNGKGATQERFKALYDDTQVVGIKTGLGLHLIRDLAKAIDCEITVDTKINLGTIITLKLK